MTDALDSPPKQPSKRDTSTTAHQLTLPCVLSFNANDPTGAGGLAADIGAMGSASVHMLPVVTAVLIRDTTAVQDHVSLDAEAINDQARMVLEDIPVTSIKVGFLGSPENISAVAQIANDYADTPVVAYMPSLTWMDDIALDAYLDAFTELMLPQTAVLVGNYSTLCRWLLPDWASEKPPTPRDVARAAQLHGVSYTLVTGLNAPEQFLENHLASPETVLATARFERFDTTFTGAGETLSAALTALLGAGEDLQSACAEALTYLDQSLDAGFAPGMGHALPDRLFWGRGEDDGIDDTDDTDAPDTPTLDVGHHTLGDFPLDDTKH